HSYPTALNNLYCCTFCSLASLHGCHAGWFMGIINFGRGNAADCRRHVQKLNAMRGPVVLVQPYRSMGVVPQHVNVGTLSF
uniref:Uncharacterized protein n=1 Tax=Oreochromis niloticus TaxID=8128 RepID=A0A669DAQ2_ORENI